MGGMTFAKPRPLTVEEIDQLVAAWGYGAEVLYKAGADGAQLHGAQCVFSSPLLAYPQNSLALVCSGYLISQFLSGRVNRRTDNYGGSLENRFRIVRRALEEIRRRVPDEKFMLSSASLSQTLFNGDGR